MGGRGGSIFFGVKLMKYVDDFPSGKYSIFGSECTEVQELFLIQTDTKITSDIIKSYKIPITNKTKELKTEIRKFIENNNIEIVKNSIGWYFTPDEVY